MDFNTFFQESWKWLFVTLTSLLSFFHWRENRRLENRINSKVSKDVYELDKKAMLSPLEKKIDRIEIYLRLLMEKEGIEYHE